MNSYSFGVFTSYIPYLLSFDLCHQSRTLSKNKVLQKNMFLLESPVPKILIPHHTCMYALILKFPTAWLYSTLKQIKERMIFSDALMTCNPGLCDRLWEVYSQAPGLSWWWSTWLWLCHLTNTHICIYCKMFDKYI